MRSRSLLWSFNYAIDGIVHALRTQRNMRLHVVAAVAVLIAALFFQIGRFEFIALLCAITFVFVAELANTAIEAAVDLSTDGLDPSAKVAKDVAAGAVFIASVNAVIIGYIVFFGRLTGPADTLAERLRDTPLHITLIAIALTAIAALVAKAFVPGGTWLRGGWPSGHTAIAFSISTAIAFLAHNAQVTILAYFGAALVGQSRVESDTHTIPQVVVGGLLGVLLTAAVFQLFLR